MNNNAKNENTNKMNTTEKNQNIIFERDLNDLLKYGSWDLSLLSSLNSEKTYKKNLMLIDKEWLINWKTISGYNYIKNQIFHYLTLKQKNKNDLKIIEEETKKLSESWLSIKSRYNINISNIEKVQKLNNKKYLLHVNNKTLINGKANFDIISSDISDLFTKFLDKKQIIKVGGLYNNKKLLLPFNYNDKNIDYIFINMIFIQNNKNDIGEILFEFPGLKLNIIEKIRKEISNRNITDFLKDFDDTNNKEYIFKDEDDNQYIYKALYKTKNNQKNVNNKIQINKNLKDNIVFDKNKNENKENNEEDLYVNNLIDIINFDINNLTSEQIEKKIKQIEEETFKQIEIENNLKEEEILLSKNINLKEDDIIQEYNKYEDLIKEIESKINNSLNEIQVCQEKEKKVNYEYEQLQNDFNSKKKEINKKLIDLNNNEALIKTKIDEIIKKESILNNKEKVLNKKENEINLAEKNNKTKKNELNDIEDEIKQKNEILKNEEEMENKKLKKEVEEEMKQLQNQINKNDKNKNNASSFGESKDNDNSLNAQGLKKMKSQPVNHPSIKLNKLNSHSNNPKFQSYNSNINNNKSNKERISLPNADIKNKLSSEVIEIDKNKISIGFKKINPVNLNSIIQCFIHLKEIREGLLNLEKNNFFEKNKECFLAENFLYLTKSLYFDDKLEAHSLNDFWNLIQEKDKNKVFIKNKLYVDSKMLINFLIEELHKELNIKKVFSDNELMVSNNNFERQNEKEALHNYLEEFTKNNNSLISKNFYGLIRKKIICQGCKAERYSFEYYSFLTININKIKNFLSNEEKVEKNKNKNKKNIKLLDFFDYYNKPEYLVGDSNIFCKKCQAKNGMIIIKNIYSTHPIIPIIIERDEDPKLNKDKIDFPEELDLSKYIEYKTSSKHFYLCGVVTNFGYNNNYGKFEAFCRMEQNGKWYNINDEIVSESNWEDIVNNGIQYVLFYHKI